MKNLIKFFHIIFLFAIINYTQANINCKTKLDQCQTDFFKELKTYKFNDYEISYYNLCSSNGSYMRFVNCIRRTSEQLQCKRPLHQELCNKRGFKIFSYRYTWRSNIVHDICYRTSTILDQDFFKHEKCISEVLNSQKWYCDWKFYEKTKKVNGLEACEHWKAFRTCIYEKVEEHCGKMVANLSDYLFHSHTSYFTQYSICNLPGEPHTKCWLDILDSIPRMPILNDTKNIIEMTSSPMLKPNTSTILAKIIAVSTSIPRIEKPSTIEHNNDQSENNNETINDENEEKQRQQLIDNEQADHNNFNPHTNLVREAKMNVQTNNYDEVIDQHQEHLESSKNIANKQENGSIKQTDNILLIIFSLCFFIISVN